MASRWMFLILVAFSTTVDGKFDYGGNSDPDQPSRFDPCSELGGKSFSSKTPDQKLKSFINCFSTKEKKPVNLISQLTASLHWDDKSKTFFVQNVEESYKKESKVNIPAGGFSASGTTVACCTPEVFVEDSICNELFISSSLPLAEQIWMFVLGHAYCTFVYCGSFQSSCDDCPAFENKGACCSPYDFTLLNQPDANLHHCCHTSEEFCVYDNLQTFQGVNVSCGCGCGACCQNESCSMVVEEVCNPGTFLGANVACEEDTCDGIVTPDECACGWEEKRKKRSADSKRLKRVIGGNDVNPPNSYPWVVQVNYEYTFGGLGRRHGAILSPDYVLIRELDLQNVGGDPDDPATCPNTFAASRITVVAGAHFLTGDPDAVPYAVQCVHYGPTIADDGTNARWALLQMATPIAFNEKVDKICLPPEENIPFEEDPCALTGWGHPYPTLLSDHALKELIIVQANPDPWAGTFYTSFVGQTGGTACINDWGAPVTCEVDGSCYLYGLVYGVQGCESGTNQLTKVLKVDFELTWINSFI